MLTTEQVKNRTKTVTRRLGWWFLKPGDILNACEKCQGLKKGEKIKRICRIEILSVREEKLYEIDRHDCVAEGFPKLTPDEFVKMFCKANKGCLPEAPVNRIEFEYINSRMDVEPGKAIEHIKEEKA
jgi:hypothetical protein